MRLSSTGIALALLAASACYNPSLKPGAQMCSADGRCPSGFSCFGDGRCYPKGSNPTCSPACAAPTPQCDPTLLKCVQCVADADCQDGMLCKANKCTKGCSATHPGCDGDAGLSCDVDMGQCRGCVSDAECAGGDSTTPRCDTAHARCVPCLPTSDNCGNATYCAAMGDGYACVAGCKTVSDCIHSPAGDDAGSGPGDDGGVNDAAASDDSGAADAAILDAAAGDAAPVDATAPPDLVPASPDGGASSTACCNHACIDTSASAANCGMCGNACGANLACCAAACTDLKSDPLNCGGCGVACSGPNVKHGLCMNGACVVDTCQGSFRDCNHVFADGCEIDSASDVGNCGLCNKACGNSVNNGTAGCIKGLCGIAMCNMGFGDCDNNPSNGCETSLVADARNCGMCGTACGTPKNGAGRCMNSGCAITSCTSPFQDCNHTYSDGCEANVNTDPKNCSACGKICNLANVATNVCNAGNCNIGQCAGGFLDCDKIQSTGCEVNVSSDSNNCGGCMKPCPADQVCVGGMCKK